MDTVTTSIQWRESAGSRAHLIKSKQTEQTTNIDKGRKMNTTTEKTGTGEINPNLKTDRITALEDYEKAIEILGMVGYEGFKRISKLILKADEKRGSTPLQSTFIEDLVDFNRQATPQLQKELKIMQEEQVMKSFGEAQDDYVKALEKANLAEQEMRDFEELIKRYGAEQRGETLETES